jgi:hypothetical protein
MTTTAGICAWRRRDYEDSSAGKLFVHEIDRLARVRPQGHGKRRPGPDKRVDDLCAGALLALRGGTTTGALTVAPQLYERPSPFDN